MGSRVGGTGELRFPRGAYDVRPKGLGHAALRRVAMALGKHVASQAKQAAACRAGIDLWRHRLLRRPVCHGGRFANQANADAAHAAGDVFPIGQPYALETGDLPEALAEETRCERHTLHPYPTDKTGDRG